MMRAGAGRTTDTRVVTSTSRMRLLEVSAM
ncbi:MAG: hypothetical protein QOF30_2315 [Acidimicrobiaceae bacterium]|nr:hypothetical protein [Acidimicrobiaceae bacterium]